VNIRLNDVPLSWNVSDRERPMPNQTESWHAYNKYASHATTRLLEIDETTEKHAGKTHERKRMALVVGVGRQQSYDFYQLLLRRLRIFSSIMAVVLASVMVLMLWNLYTAISADRIDELGGSFFVRFVLISIGLPLFVSAFSALLLRWRPPVTTVGLRTIELFIIGAVASVMLWGMGYPEEWYGLLERRLADQPLLEQRAFMGVYVEFTSLRWFALLVGYGALIPNTWRRCAAVVTVLALSPLIVFALLSLWLRPLQTEVVVTILSNLALWLGVAVTVVVFTAYRIEMLRQEAADARKLGQYVLKERLGAGGMGEVYLAEHVLLCRPCAVKLIRPERAADQIELLRFEREVRLTATLTHPNTIQVFDYGHTEDKVFYYVMEYLEGLTLEDIVRRHGPLPPARAIYFLRQVCAALQEAHDVGLIHRDVKPSNVRVCERGGEHDVIKLLDFGLVLPFIGASEGETKLTQEGTITGTPDYMSPEQAVGKQNVDGRSDIYSVGALAYYLLTGAPPFVYPSPIRILAAHLYEAARPLIERRADLPGDLEAIVLRCLAKDPNDRFPDARSLEQALAGCGTSDDWSAKEAASWWLTKSDDIDKPL
jgi:eukaryotic-like serine/threonine-protein kinase